MPAVRWYSLLFLVVSVRPTLSQSANLQLFQQRISVAFSSAGTYPNAVTFAGNLTTYAGSQHDSGNLSLALSTDGSTSENWSLAAKSYSFAQGPLNGLDHGRSCLYVDLKAHEHPYSGANCLRSVPWFLPSLVLAPRYSALLSVADTTTQEDVSNGIARLTYTQRFPSSIASPDSIVVLKNATTFSICYDVQSALPTKLLYREALDGDDSRGIEIEIRYGDYRSESGYMVPHHLQRYVQRTLSVDFDVNAATIQ